MHANVLPGYHPEPPHPHLQVPTPTPQVPTPTPPSPHTHTSKPPHPNPNPNTPFQTFQEKQNRTEATTTTLKLSNPHSSFQTLKSSNRPSNLPTPNPQPLSLRSPSRLA
ncbi:hypothetical protein K439DRAFT_1626787, partial [Ramaria rubella]